MKVRFLRDVTIGNTFYTQGHVVNTDDEIIINLANDHNGPLGAAVQNLDHPGLFIPESEEYEDAPVDNGVTNGDIEEGGSD